MQSENEHFHDGSTHRAVVKSVYEEMALCVKIIEIIIFKDSLVLNKG